MMGPKPYRHLAMAFGLTLVFACLFSAVLVWVGSESMRPEPFHPHRVALYVLSGLAVSCLEEPVFRRFLLRRLAWRRNAAVGALLSSLLYAEVHYLRPGRVAEQAHYSIADSLGVYRGMLENLARPLSDPGPGLGLFLLGLLLCAVVRRGGLAGTIGIHAALIFYVKSSDTFLFWNHVDRHWLAGTKAQRYDGVLFWVFCSVALIALLVWPRRDSSGSTGVRPGLDTARPRE